MLGFMNNTSTQKHENLFFPLIKNDFPAPLKTITTPVRASTHSLTDMTTLNAAINGLSVTCRMKNTDWLYADDEMLLTIGDTSNYLFFQKRQSGLKFRWGLVSGGTIQIIDEFPAAYLYDGWITFGASLSSSRLNFCVNGYTVSYQTDNITLPAITSADTLHVGRFFSPALAANSSVIFDTVHIWDHALSVTDIENATFESAPIDGTTRQDNLWSVIKAGQSNSMGYHSATAPAGLSYTNTNRIKMMNKDLTIRPYADPYTTLTHGNTLTVFDEAGGFSGAGVTLDQLADEYDDLEFMAVACNQGNTGLLHNGGAGIWDYVNGGIVSTGTPKICSFYALALYINALITKQKSNLLCLEWYQGETDALTGSSATQTAYQDALTRLFDSLRLVLPPLRLVVNLCDAPVSGFLNWGTIQSALSGFSYANTATIDASGLSVEASSPQHLDGAGQRDLGQLAAAEIIKMVI